MFRLLLMIPMLASLFHLNDGGDAGDGATDPPKPPVSPTPPVASDEKKFSQADLDRISGQTRAEARRAAENELATTLGVTIDEAKNLIEAKRAADDEQKTEAQKAREAADREKAEAETAKREALVEKQASRAERALLSAGVNPDRLNRASSLLVADLGEESDPEKIKTAAEALKTEMPEMFGSKGPRTPSSDPGSGPGAGSGNGPVGIDAGRAKARAERESAQKTPSPFEGLTAIGA